MDDVKPTSTAPADMIAHGREVRRAAALRMLVPQRTEEIWDGDQDEPGDESPAPSSPVSHKKPPTPKFGSGPLLEETGETPNTRLFAQWRNFGVRYGLTIPVVTAALDTATGSAHKSQDVAQTGLCLRDNRLYGSAFDEIAAHADHFFNALPTPVAPDDRSKLMDAINEALAARTHQPHKGRASARSSNPHANALDALWHDFVKKHAISNIQIADAWGECSGEVQDSLQVEAAKRALGRRGSISGFLRVIELDGDTFFTRLAQHAGANFAPEETQTLRDAIRATRDFKPERNR